MTDQPPATDQPPSTTPVYLGIDVAKDWIDIGQAGCKTTHRVANTEAAITAWLQAAGRPPVALCAFEPTGGYERTLRRCLLAAALPFARVHPNELVAFRTQRGRKAKTDALDATLLAEFAQTELARRGLRPLIEADATLRDLVARRRQLTAMLHAERCRQAMAQNTAVQQTMHVIIDAVRASIDHIERDLAAHIAARPALTAMAANLRSLKGIGPVSVFTLFADLPELGQCSGKQIASLVGLAPHVQQSGKSHKRAATGHGRPGVRAVLFNAARSAIQHNPVLRDVYQRLVHQNHRPGKVALIAVMRKMIVILNAIARTNQPWNGIKTTETA